LISLLTYIIPDFQKKVTGNIHKIFLTISSEQVDNIVPHYAQKANENKKLVIFSGRLKTP
jgi:hypothetical protein